MTPPLPPEGPDDVSGPQAGSGVGTDGTETNSSTHGSGGPIRPAALPGRKRSQRRRELPRGLPSWRRLRATRDFARVERQGVRANGQWLAVTVRPGPGRLGLVVSKKVDNRANQRNLLKRRLREVFRADKARWALRQRPSAPGTGGTGGGSVDVVVTVRPEAKGRSFAELQHDAWQTLDQAIAKLSSVKRPKPPHGGPGR